MITKLTHLDSYYKTWQTDQTSKPLKINTMTSVKKGYKTFFLRH